jgi:glycosyltransferase involved in cell wall biosynthesis
MKVLVVLAWSFPTQQAIWEEAGNLDVDLHVAYTLDVPRSGQESIGAPAFGTAHRLRAWPVCGDRQVWMAYRGLGQLVRRLRPDIVHVLSEPWGNVVTQALATSPTVVAHGAENLWDQGGRIERLLRHAATVRNLRRCRGFVSWNQVGIEWARRRRLPALAPTLVLAHELPRLERFADARARRDVARRRLGVDDDATVVGYAGRLVAEKGVLTLIDAWAKVPRGAGSRLVLAGAGPLEPELRRRAAGDPSVQLLPAVPFSEVPDLMACFDVLTLPSRSTSTWVEQFGRVLTEAMAAGVPIVATRSGAIPEVVGDAALLVPEASPVELAAGIGRLIQDQSAATAYAEAGLERFMTAFAPAVGAQRLVSYWHDVVGLVPS